jgi:hypothetical protein
MQLNEFGQIAAHHWQWLTTQYPYVQLDEWIVMPNHFHGILILTNASHCWCGSRTAPTSTNDATHPTPINVADPPIPTNDAIHQSKNDRIR